MTCPKVLTLKTANVSRGTFQITLTQLVQYAVYGIFYVVVAKTGALNPADLGVLSILIFLASTISLLTGLALPTAMTKYMAEYIEKNKPETAAAVQKTVVAIVLTISSICLAAIICSSEVLSEYFFGTSANAPLLVFMSIYAYLSGLTAILNSSLQALGFFGKMATLALLHVVLGRTTAALLALLHLGVSGVLGGFVIGSAVSLTYAVVLTRGRLPPSNSYAPYKPLVRFSLPLIIGTAVSLAINWADIAIIASATSNYGLVGVYYLALNSVGMLSVVWGPVTSTIFPLLSAQHGVQRFESISSTIRVATRYITYLMLPSCLGLAIIAPTALEFFYGENYVTGAIPLAVLSFATVVISFSAILNTAMTAIGKTIYLLKINAISALSNILLLLVLVPHFEAVGAAFARFFVQSISLLLVIHALRKNLKLTLDRESLWKSAAASLLIVPYLLLVENAFMTLPAVLRLVLEITGASAAYLSALCILKALHERDFELLKQAFPRLEKYLRLPEKLFSR